MEEWHYSKDHMRQIYDEWKQTMPEWLISESHDLEVVTHYDDWKNDEQARRMKEDIERLLREENAEKK